MVDIYIIELDMSSPNRQVRSTRIDEYKKEIEYAFNEETRKKISKTRMWIYNHAYNGTLNFYNKLKIVKADALPAIKEAVREGHGKMKAIDSSLHADVIVIELSREAMMQGELYRRVVDSIVWQIYKEISDRLSKVLATNETLPSVSKKALLRQLEELRKINVIDEPEIEQRIREIESHLQADAIEPVRAMLDRMDRELDTLNERWGFLEMEA